MSDLKFKKSERLSSRKEISEVLSSGKRFNKYKIHLYSLEIKEERVTKVKVLFAVPKKRFKKAVDRNLLKRRMRESYRLNKSILRPCNKALNLMFIYNTNEELSYEEIEHKIVLLLKGLCPSNENNS